MGQKGEDYNIWLDGLNRPTYAPISSDLTTDVVVVGGGITGVLTAYSLLKEGKRVVLVDKGRLGEWATDCTTGFLTDILDTDYSSLSWIYGEEKADLIRDSHLEAIAGIENIIKEENIDCDFRRVTLRVLSPKGEEEQKIENQATYQPMAFLVGVANKIIKLGGLIFEQSEVISIDKKGETWELPTKLGYKIKSQAVMVATYSPWGEPWHLYFKKAMYRSYVLELLANKKIVDSWEEGLYVDTKSPYHYFRLQELNGKTQIIFGGADHRADLPVSREKSYKILLVDAKRLFGEDLLVKRRWAGPILESIDGLPYIGRDKRTGLYHAFAFSGNGLTYSFIASQIIAEQICRPGADVSGWGEIYRVNRLPSWRAMLVKGRDYSKILWGGAIRSWLSRL